MNQQDNPLQHRRFDLSFQDNTAKHWANSSPFLTAVLNTYTLLVPDNEIYYMRCLRKVMNRIDDTHLKTEMLTFFRQEGEHGMAHRKYWENLRRQGYQIDRFIKPVNFFLYQIVERVLTLKMNVAVVAAIEHFNAVLGHLFLSKNLLKDSDPDLRKLFYLHFAEEIEHKAVSFNVLTAIGTSRLLRIFTMALVMPLLFFTFLIGTTMLLWQDRQLFRYRTWRDLWDHFFSQDHMAHGMAQKIGMYFRPSFNPSENDDYHLATAVFAQYGFHNSDSCKPKAKPESEEAETL